ncbi:plexin-D1 [Lampetra fluviatilis]
MRAGGGTAVATVRAFHLPSVFSITTTIIVVVAIVQQLLTRSAHGFHVHGKFQFGEKTNNFAVDGVFRKVYVGTVNNIYQLSDTLRREDSVSTGPINDSMLCHAPTVSPTCVHERTSTDNYNKLLVVDSEQQILLSCGSVHQGACEVRRLGSIVDVVVSTEKLNTKNLYMASNHADAPTVGVLVRIDGSKYGIMVGATFTGQGSDYWKPSGSPPDYRYENTPEIAFRSMNVSEKERLFSYEYDSEESIFKISGENKVRSKLQFVDMFAVNNYVYILVNNNTGDAKENNYKTSIVRICLSNTRIHESYVQLSIDCGEKYDNIQSAFVSRDLLYVLFKSFKNGSTIVCEFPLGDIDTRIANARKDCFTRHLPVMTALDFKMDKSETCKKAGTTSTLTLTPEQANCGGTHMENLLVVLAPVSGHLVFTQPNLTAVAAIRLHGFTVLFLGNSTGHLIKAVKGDAGSGVKVMDTELLDYGNPVHPNMLFDPADNSFLYVMTSSKIGRVKVTRCAHHTSCASCLHAGDPYCGWCTLLGRCTLQNRCPHSSVASHWVDIGSGMTLCPTLEFTTTYINADERPQEVKVQVSGLVPELKDLDLWCEYEATKTKLSYVNSTLACSLPPPANLSQLSSNEGSRTVTVFMVHNQTRILSGNVTFYKCSNIGAIHVNIPCTSCTDRRWACHWCAGEHSCVSAPSQCSDVSNVVTDASACPRITASSSAGQPSASGSTTSLFLNTTNTKAIKDKNVKLVCKIGTKIIVDAEWVDADTIKCSPVKLTTNMISEIFPVNLAWKSNGASVDNPDNIQVEVYTCGGATVDCGQCSAMRHRQLRCEWCATPDDAVPGCRLNTTCRQPIGECPAPVVTQISPQSGPLQGGTRVTITGSNMGGRFEDIEQGLFIGAAHCSPLKEFYEVSKRIVCVTSRSNVTGTQVHVHVNGRVSESTVTYTYADPKVDKVEPLKGIKAGGMVVTIRGRDLDVGSSLDVRLDANKSCTILNKISTVIKCKMPEWDSVGETNICLYCDDSRQCLLEKTDKFKIIDNPMVVKLHPYKSHKEGGRQIQVSLTGEVVAQKVAMSIHLDSTEVSKCNISSSSKEPMIECPSPRLNRTTGSRLRVKAQFHFDNHISIQDFDYYENPRFELINKPTLQKKELIQLTFKNFSSNLDLALSEIYIFVGHVPCLSLQFLDNKDRFTCSVNLSTVEDSSLPVTVQVGHYKVTVEMLTVDKSNLTTAIALFLALLIVCIIVLVMVFYIKNKRAKHNLKKILVQMADMEAQIRDEIRKGFAELQTDMTDLASEFNGNQGIPFLEYKHFAIRILFPETVEQFHTVSRQLRRIPATDSALVLDHPLFAAEWKVPELRRQMMEEGIGIFSTLLNNQKFLITFIHTLEQQKDFTVKDRCYLASWLTAALQGKLEYYTAVLKELLVDLIRSSTNKHPKLMLRRTESVVEKMLTNWMSICMYGFLRDRVGEPFFLLLTAIRQQISKGPVDAVTGRAKYTLSEDWLLRENIEATPLNINVSFQGCGMDSLAVKVLDCDTIGQVKEKILDGFYKNSPCSVRPRVEDVDLEWFPESGGSIMLRNLVDISQVEGEKQKINRVSVYQIPDGASLALSFKDKKSICPNEDNVKDNDNYFHLVTPADEMMEVKKSKSQQGKRKKVLPEVYLTRLLSTKGTLQKFVTDLFRAILTYPTEQPPMAIKFFFDFLEEQAESRGIVDPETVHIWKTNSLPLRFWVNILKNPQFVFDLEKTTHMDACLSVIAQAFIDACSLSSLTLGKDSPTNKLLYAKEIPEYKSLVFEYYKDIQQLPMLSEQEMNSYMAEESMRYTNEFNTNYAMSEIYKYAKRYRHEIVDSLEENLTTRKMQLAHKFEQVIVLMEDNIYETCSEV